MTEDEKKEYRKALVEKVKKYCKIDYEDDEDVLEDMILAAFENLHDLIPDIDFYALTSRQRILLMLFTKEQYENTDPYQEANKMLANGYSTMLLNEQFKGGGA